MHATQYKDLTKSSGWLLGYYIQIVRDLCDISASSGESNLILSSIFGIQETCQIRLTLIHFLTSLQLKFYVQL